MPSVPLPMNWLYSSIPRICKLTGRVYSLYTFLDEFDFHETTGNEAIATQLQYTCKRCELLKTFASKRLASKHAGRKSHRNYFSSNTCPLSPQPRCPMSPSSSEPEQARPSSPLGCHPSPIPRLDRDVDAVSIEYSPHLLLC